MANLFKSKKSRKGLNRYDCSNGQKVSQATIDRKRSESHRKFLELLGANPICEACQNERANDFDHTIAQARCKVIHKTELIWTMANQPMSCRNCHHQWENFKSGEYLNHKNYSERMDYLEQHDPEGFRIRTALTPTPA